MPTTRVRLTKEYKFQQLMEPVLEAFADLNLILGREFQIRITDVIWPWPNQTIRKRGKQPAGSPRNIVDLGGLRDSYVMRDLKPKAGYRHVWAVEYAMAVHNGAVINNAWGRGIRVTIPARPWTRVTMREFNAQSVWDRLVKQKVAAKT